jgi:alkylation response protein AidB-like acyl-CoA dehydrogenase
MSLRPVASRDPPEKGAAGRLGQNGLVRHPVFTADHDELRDAVRRFVDKEIGPNVDEWEDTGFFPDWVFRRCGELGFLGLHYPERWGGGGGDLTAGLIFIEELARCGCGAIPMAVSVQTDMCTPVVAEFGTDEQRERYLVPAIAGEKIGAIAITEPDAGSDVAAITPRATRDGDTWVINGRKMYITNGARADFLTLVAQTQPGSGHRGISLFLVDTSLPGVSVSRTLKKLRMWSSDTAEIALDDVVVPHASLVGQEPGQGFAQLMWQLQYERLAGAAACVGHASRVLDDTIAFAHERRACGRPIADHQVIAHKLADAATELEAARALLYTTAWRVQEGDYPVAEISMTKKYAAQVQNRLVDACLQVHGGAGYMAETPVSRAFRDARLQRIGAGTDEIMNDVIAKRRGITSSS